MTEFLNYKVALQLKDGTETLGLISHVDSNLITLGDRTINNSSVKDLKVVKLPPDVLKTQQKKKHQHANISLIDDAIVSASGSRAGTPKVSKHSPDWGVSTDVQDIKSGKEFDFAANLAMFDKKSVFADFQKSDHVSAKDRLVGHNTIDNVLKMKKSSLRKDKYDNDEMVISANKEDNWNKIGSVSQRLALPVSAGSQHTLIILTPREAQQFKFEFSNSGLVVPLASPVQLIEIEREAQESFGIGFKTSTEICATNFYKLIVDTMLGGSVRLSNRQNHNLPPLVLLLIGSSRSSSKAFAAGRHLTNHGVRVLAYVINEEILEGELLHQCDLFEKAGGKVVNGPFAKLSDILNNQLETPVELIIDALQGFDGQLLDLFYNDKMISELKELIRWANNQRAKVLSIDISAGVDGGSGTVVDPLLQIHTKYIVSLELPITGLVHAYNNGTFRSLTEEIQHFVVDAGIPNGIYSSKPHLRKFDKFWYCAEAYLPLKVADA